MRHSELSQLLDEMDNEDLLLTDEEATNTEGSSESESAEPKVQQIKSAPKITAVNPGDGNAVMITGATHSRELLSMQVPLYMCLKLIHQGLINKRERYVNMLRETKFYFIPVVNVDGAALVEEHWNEEGKILNKRKNMNPENIGTCGEEDSGVDINRNFGVDWAHGNEKNHSQLCSDFWPGQEAFSEPESRALRDFVGQHRSEIKFIINCHTSGNEFIWPYNGREYNDLEKRNPGYTAIFQDIAKNAPFPSDVLKGNAKEVIGDVMGGDQDDYMLATYGIPSVTSEMGFFG